MSNPYASPGEANSAAVDLSQDVRGLQIVTGALAGGATMILAVMLVMNSFDMNGAPEILSWIGFGMGGMMFIQHMIVPRFIVSNQLRKLSAELQTMSVEEKSASVMGALRSGHIIGCAMLEGAAVLNCVAYMTTSFFGNVIVAGVLIAIIALKIPTNFGMQNRVSDRLQTLEMGA